MASFAGSDPGEAELATLAAFAGRLADAARSITFAASSAELSVENKAQGGAFDPVTAADREVEQAMRAMIGEHHPEHGVTGEEFGPVAPDRRYVWSLDPIDGTRSFICGLPSWSTLIGLLADGEPVLGIIDVPRVDERFVGFAGKGRLISAQGERPLRASGCAALAEARLSTTDPYLFAGAEADAFERLRRAARVARFGLDAYAYARLAAGGIDLVVESGLQPHDVHALVPVIRAAGGVIGNWEGGTDLASGRVVAAASVALFEQAVAALSMA